MVLIVIIKKETLEAEGTIDLQKENPQHKIQHNSTLNGKQ